MEEFELEATVNRISALYDMNPETPEEKAAVLVARELARIELTLCEIRDKVEAVRNEIEIANL